MQTFENKTVFITGGGGGIGLGMARAFAERGMQVALADVDENALAQSLATLQALGCQALALPLDITDRQACKTAVAKVIEHFGALHIVCANAGVTGFLGPLQQAPERDWDWIIDVNLRGTVNTVQSCLPHLLQQAGNAHIVITSSISGLRIYDPSRGQGMYNTTKYALVGYGEALSVDLADNQVGVSIVCPGVVNTDLSNSGRNRPDKYGGAFHVGDDFVLAKAAKAYGTDPLLFGHWVIRGIEENQLYVITHPQDRDFVARRHQRILDAFDHSAALTSSE